MTVGSLFSGIGGFDLGLGRAGFTIKWQVEIDEYCRAVLKKHWPTVPCHYDIKEIDWRWIDPVDVLCGGPPCQPFSCAGKRLGAADDRNLWPETLSAVANLEPRWIFFENVSGGIPYLLKSVLPELERLGYTNSPGGEIVPLSIPACGVDAPHIRQRIWIVAYASQFANGKQCGGIREAATEAVLKASRNGSDNRGDDVANPDGHEQRRRISTEQVGRQRSKKKASEDGDATGIKWCPEPAVGRVADGVPNRVDRLKGLGNAIVPQIAEALGRMILDASQQEAP